MSQKSSEYSGVAAIFCGGRSTRMGGQPKAGLIGPDGLTLVESVYQAIAGVCSRVVLVGHAEGVPRTLIHLPRLKDIYPLYGPMGALATLLSSQLADEYLVCPCDLMGCKTELFQFIIDQEGPLPIVLRGAKGLDPLIGRYPANIHDHVSQKIRSKKLAMYELVEELSGTTVQTPQHLEANLINVNSPDDLPEQ